MMKSAKRLLLVSANQHTVPYPVYPLGISYLKTYLEEKTEGLEIRIFDFVNHSMHEFAETLVSYDPHFTGISLRNIDDVNIYKQESFIAHYKEIVVTTRKHSKSLVIVGGAGFSIYPEQLFETLNPDFGVYGEGEKSLLQLIQHDKPGDALKNISGLIYRDNGKIIVNDRIRHLETPSLQFENDLIDYYWPASGMLNIQTKRGCPHHCIYCTYPLIEGRKIRTLEIDQVVDTLADLHFNKNINYVFFTDSVFNSENDYNMELAERLISENIRIHWGGYFNFMNFHFDVISKLKDAGLAHIEFGTESLSDPILRNYRKPFTVDDVLQASAMCNELQIHFAHFLILGGYGETMETLQETFENSKKIQKSVFFPFIGMRIYPGTWLHQRALKEKKIDPDQSLLKPVYYVSDSIELQDIKSLAKATAQTWIFPDEDLSAGMNRMRKKSIRGPLWEYLIR